MDNIEIKPKDRQTVIDILGLNTECYTNDEITLLVYEFNHLIANAWDENCIWLKEEKGIYTQEKVYDETEHLIVALAK